MKLISLIALLIFSFFAYSDYRPDDSVLVLGSKADPSADKEIKTNGDGQGSLVYNEASDEWRFYNTPSEYFTFADFLSGGVSYITGFPSEIKNGDFEAKNYLDGWECTSGKCSLDDSTPMFGEKAVTFEPDLTNEYLRTEFKFMSEGLFSKDCQAKATYSLDIDLQLTFRVVDQDLNVIATQDLTETSTSQQAGEVTLDFTCPSVADFIADSDSAYLRVEVINKSDASPVSEFDNVHLGKPISAGGGGSGVDVSTDNAIARFDGTEGDLQNSSVLVDDSANISNITGLYGSGTLNLFSGGGGADRISMKDPVWLDESLNYAENTDSTTTGTNATLSTGNSSLINLRNASLVSIQEISFNGSKERNKVLYLVNQTGSDITLVHNNDESGGATNTRINNPAGADFILKNNYTVQLVYNYHTSIGTHRRGWNIISNESVLVETTLPDKFSASFDGSAGASVSTLTESNTGAFDCNTYISTGIFECTINESLSVVPTINCEITEDIGGRECTVRAKTTSSFRINITKTNDLTVENRDFDVFIEKQGTDAKQSVQVYKSIPKVADNINVFSATVSTATGAVTQENVNWLETTCATGTSPTQAVCDLEISLDEELSCAVAFESGTGARSATVLSTATQITISSTISSSGADAGGNTAIVCVKSGNDFKLPTVQPVIVGQVRNSHAESAMPILLLYPIQMPLHN